MGVAAKTKPGLSIRAHDAHSIRASVVAKSLKLASEYVSYFSACATPH